MNEFQKVNHFVGINNFGDKAAMWRHVSKQYRRLGEQYDICPMTYIFPQAYKRWKQEREMNKYKDLFILKPTNMNCGKGIRVIGKKDKVKNRKNFIIQKYVSNPHLLRGFKYDLRVYILVTSFDPLIAYFHQDGLVRLATEPYSNSSDSLSEKFIHLTNYSVNKNSENFIKNKNEKDSAEFSSKLSFPQLRTEY